MRFRLFNTHTPKPKRFTYRPRFYDEVAERHKRLEAQYGPFGSDEKHNETHIHEIFEGIRARRKHPGHSSYSAGLRIAVIAALLCALVYLFLFVDISHVIRPLQSIF